MLMKLTPDIVGLLHLSWSVSVEGLEEGRGLALEELLDLSGGLVDGEVDDDVAHSGSHLRTVESIIINMEITKMYWLCTGACKLEQVHYSVLMVDQ